MGLEFSFSSRKHVWGLENAVAALSALENDMAALTQEYEKLLENEAKQGFAKYVESAGPSRKWAGTTSMWHFFAAFRLRRRVRSQSFPDSLPSGC